MFSATWLNVRGGPWHHGLGSSGSSTFPAPFMSVPSVGDTRRRAYLFGNRSPWPIAGRRRAAVTRAPNPPVDLDKLTVRPSGSTWRTAGQRLDVRHPWPHRTAAFVLDAARNRLNLGPASQA